jgi:hypothetical protein
MTRVAICLVLLLGLALGEARADSGSAARRLDRLEAGVQAAESVRAIKRLQHSFAHYLDVGAWSDLADLFTADATGEFGDLKVSGRKALRRHFMSQAGRSSEGLAQGQLHTHLIMQPIVTLDLDGRTARGTWHEFAMLGRYGESATWRGGIYENEYVLDNGIWKIRRLRYFEQYRGDYDDDGHKAPPAWNVPYHFEAKHVGVTIPQQLLQRGVSSRVRPGLRAAQLAERVRRLNDETEVQNLQHAFGYYLDRKLWDDVVDLFAESGSLEIAPGGVYEGKARIRRALEHFYGPSPLRRGELFDHIQLATVVTLSPDRRTAKARTAQLSMLGVVGEFARWELGTYENELIKDDGVWKLQAVRYYPRLITDYDEGWARNAQPAPGVSKALPPDRRSSRAHAAYPDVHVVPFHFGNPGRSRVASVSRVTAAPDAELDALIAETERRLDAAIAIDAVENLNSSYGYYLDESAWDDMADTFASTGSKEITGAGVYVGPERIRKILNMRGPRGGRTPNFFTIHQLTQPVIHVSADGQSAKARMRLFQCGGNADGSSGSWIGGIYENTAVKEGGEWKFGVQDLHHMFNASYRNGWARIGLTPQAQPGKPLTRRDVPGGGIQQGLGGAASPSRLAAEFPPDRPIRAKQYAFPEIVEPAFHYRNPVSGRMPTELLP